MELGGNKGHGGSGRHYLENSAHEKVDIEVLARLMEPENLEIFLRYILKVLDERRHQYFRALSTHQRDGTTSWETEKDGWRVRGKNVAQQEQLAKTSVHDILSIKG